MSASQINITLGTAGHIDHGKTALIKCLTGCETDLLKAEKERGMSIELGFAPCTVADLEVGIVDVPGHEKFIKTMVAGASGIDGVIFVIAADDGVMLQTKEHLEILTLLGIKHGIVALTKVDCVSGDRINNVTAEIEKFLFGTFLENTSIIPLSSITGQGFGEFLEALKDLVKKVKPKSTDGVFRLPIERAFSVKGYGTVITGIPVSGLAKTGDNVVLLPGGTKGRIKAIQVYKKDSSEVKSGQCAAVNISGWDYKKISRGDVVSIEKYFSPQQLYLCKLKVLDLARFNLKTGSKVKFHTGTSEVNATIYLMQGNTISAGQESLVQVKLDSLLVAGPGDRFILRSPSPARTFGGGIIVEAIEKRLKRSHPEVLIDAIERAQAVITEKKFVEYCIKTADNHAINEIDLSRRTKLLPDRIIQIVSELFDTDAVLQLDAGLYIHNQTAKEEGDRLIEIVKEFHRSSPQSPGISRDRFYEQAKLRKNIFDGLVKLLISHGTIVERKHCIALTDHSESFTATQQKLLTTIEKLFIARMFKPPKLEEIVKDTCAQSMELSKTLKILIEQELLVQVEKDLFFHHMAIDKACELLTVYIQKEGELESVKFKYLLDTTRKFAIPLLDYFDRVGITRRVGNTRYLKTRRVSKARRT